MFKRAHTVQSYSATPDGKTFVAITSTPTNINDLFVFDAAAGTAAAKQITRVNEDLFKSIKLSEPEEVSWTSFDGRTIQGWVLHPPDFDKSKHYPFILEIHGGPHSAYGNVFTHEFHWMAAKGYVVLFPNPRGSSNYGQEFGNIIQYRYPGDDYKDLMAGVDAIVKRGYIDQARMGVTGGSGGGLLTNWTITQTPLPAAAVSMRSIADWSGFWYTADFTQFTPSWFRKAPWEDPQDYAASLPITHVARVNMLLMLIDGDDDLRTPPSDGGEMMFRALKYLKVPTVMVRVPGETHELSRSGKPRHRVERLHDPADLPSMIAQEPARNLTSHGICELPFAGRASDDLCSIVLRYGMKRDFNLWLATLGDTAPVKSLTALREWNLAHKDQGAIRYGQGRLDFADSVDLDKHKARIERNRREDLTLTREEGLDAAIDAHKLDALLFPGSSGQLRHQGRLSDHRGALRHDDELRRGRQGFARQDAALRHQPGRGALPGPEARRYRLRLRAGNPPAGATAPHPVPHRLLGGRHPDLDLERPGLLEVIPDRRELLGDEPLERLVLPLARLLLEKGHGVLMGHDHLGHIRAVEVRLPVADVSLAGGASLSTGGFGASVPAMRASSALVLPWSATIRPAKALTSAFDVFWLASSPSSTSFSPPSVALARKSWSTVLRCEVAVGLGGCGLVRSVGAGVWAAAACAPTTVVASAVAIIQLCCIVTSLGWTSLVRRAARIEPRGICRDRAPRLSNAGPMFGPSLPFRAPRRAAEAARSSQLHRGEELINRVLSHSPLYPGVRYDRRRGSDPRERCDSRRCAGLSTPSKK